MELPHEFRTEHEFFPEISFSIHAPPLIHVVNQQEAKSTPAKLMTSDPLSYAIIGRAMQVHRELGPGLDEIFYHEQLASRLREAGIGHLFKPRSSLLHRGRVADVFEPDLVIPNHSVLELKALWGVFPPESFVQLKSYLKHYRLRQGYLFDFGKESLVTKSYLFEDTAYPSLNFLESLPVGLGQSDQTLAERIGASISRVSVEHGPGYRDTTYRGLLVADLQAEGLACEPEPSAVIHSAGARCGPARLPCLAVEGGCAVMVLSQRDGIRAADRAIVQTALRWLDYRLGLIAHFGKETVELQWVTPQRPKGIITT